MQQGMLAVLNLTLHQILLPRNENFTETLTLSRVHKHFLNASGSGHPCPCEPALCCGTAKGKRNTTFM